MRARRAQERLDLGEGLRADAHAAVLAEHRRISNG